MVTPLLKLMEGTEQVSQGNFDYHIDVDDRGEIGQLARKFNEMTFELNYTNKQRSLLNKKLYENNLNLEERIKERTSELKRIQEEVLQVFDQIPLGLLVLDTDGNIRWYNRELLKIMEIRQEGISGRRHFSEVERFHESGLQKALQSLIEQQEFRMIQQELNSFEENKQRVVEVTFRPMIHLNPEASGNIFIIRDITRDLIQKNKSRQSQRLESVGTLAGGIAHDFNNILAIILPNAQLLKMKMKYNPEYIQYVETIEKAAEKASLLTEQILSFSRGSGSEKLEILNPNEIIEDFIKMFRRLLDRKIEIILELHSGVSNIRGARGQIEQVLMNLSVNARDAIADRGKLIFRSRNITIRPPDILSHPHLEPGDYVCLEVEDTGKGIPDEERDKIFDPFFSSKKAGKGTGLGLSVVYGIIRGHKGIIDTRSAVNKGTCFSLYFPACKETSSKVKAPEDAPEPGSGTLLVVDDELMIRDTLTSMLESLNYKVLTAENGKSAVDCYEQHPGQIAAVIMDIQMPVMDGLEAAGNILKADPSARIIFTSGYADPAGFKKLTHEGFQFFLKKPYRMGILADTIKQALATDKIEF
ncbi:MAG: ATP-binding protein [Calditrichia bacterium]